jgi:Delta7-sterol 5-desaturase
MRSLSKPERPAILPGRLAGERRERPRATRTDSQPEKIDPDGAPALTFALRGLTTLPVIDAILQTLRTMPLGLAAVLLLAENLVLFGLALGAGTLLRRRFEHRRVAPPPPPLGALEIGCAAATVLLNTAVTLAGLLLWREGLIRFRTDAGLWAALDVLALLLVMDAAMYALHRVAHLAWLYPLLHRTHHRYERPRPLTLFVLNPAETLSFGGLWLVVIAAHDFSWLGMSVYLALNLAFGTIGHLGVEPLPERWTRLPLLRHLTGGTFHARHHQDVAHNFGFYTTLWDRLFGTLTPRYDEEFGRLPAAAVPLASR